MWGVSKLFIKIEDRLDISGTLFPRGIKIMGWCPAGPSLTSWGEGPSLALAGHPSSDGVTIKNALRGRCFTSTSFAPHLFLLGWLKLNLALFLDQLRLA